jgi:hypothetical protein
MNGIAPTDELDLTTGYGAREVSSWAGPRNGKSVMRVSPEGFEVAASAEMRSSQPSVLT